MNKRIALWDNAKFILMLLVVIGHFSEPYTGDSDNLRWLFLFVYSFHMPMFLFVSGLFHKDKDIKEKVLFYLSVYLAEKFVKYIVQMLLSGKAAFTLLFEDGLPWFMLALAAYELLTYALRDINKFYLLGLFTLTACFAGYDKSIGDMLAISRLIVYYPFYLLGTILPREKLEEIAGKRSVKLFCLALLLVTAFVTWLRLDDVYFLRHLFTGRNPFNDRVRPYGAFARAGCYVFSGVVGFAFLFAMPTKQIRWITPLGSRTMPIYFWHLQIRRAMTAFGLGTFMNSFGEKGRFGWLLIGVAVAYLCTVPIFEFPTTMMHQWIFEKKNKLE